MNITAREISNYVNKDSFDYSKEELVLQMIFDYFYRKKDSGKTIQIITAINRDRTVITNAVKDLMKEGFTIIDVTLVPMKTNSLILGEIKMTIQEATPILFFCYFNFACISFNIKIK